MKTPSPLTIEKIKCVFRFCRVHFLKEDRFPTTREIRTEFGWASQTAAIHWLEKAAKAGLIEKVGHGRYRFITANREERVQQFLESFNNP